MKKRTVSLLFLYVVRALCMGIAVFSFIQLLRVIPSRTTYAIYTLPYTPPPNAIETTIVEINSNFAEWVNKTVAVWGKLRGPFIYIPEAMPPWNYDLKEISPSQLEVPTEKTFIGVLWNGVDRYKSQYVAVVGVVREGRWIYLWGEHPICYYIEAQEVVPQQDPEWLSRGMQIAGLGLTFIGAIVFIIPFPRPKETAADSVMNYGPYPKRGIEGIGMLWLIGLVLLLIGVVLQMVATLF